MKNAELYWDRLEMFAKAMNIRITLRVDSADGHWNPNRREIVIDPGIEDGNMIATFLHELGHVFDDTAPIDENTAYAQNVAYGKIYKKKATKTQKKLVLACEERAWAMAVVIAKLLHIPLGAWFDREHKEAKKYYKDNY